MVRNLDGRTALITGAGRRIGREIGRTLARAGAHVVAHYHHSESDAESLVAECRAMGVRAWSVCADLSDRDQTEQLIARTVGEAGALDILINNASIFPQDTLADFTLESLESNMRVNAFAPVLLARAFADHARAGDILNLLDARMGDFDREHVSYHLSKRALYALTRMMAVEYAPAIRVNAVAPGLILPPDGSGPEYLEALRHTNPMESYGSTDDVAGAVVYLLTSNFTTGQVLYVDGGRHMIGDFYG